MRNRNFIWIIIVLVLLQTFLIVLLNISYYVRAVFILKLGFIKSSIAAFLGMLAVGVLEGFSIPFISFLTGVAFKDALRDPLLRIIFPLPDEIILGLAAYLCRKRHFSLIPKDILTVKPGKDKEDEK